jgi:endonuclease/exonuclease/phosphatase family metal-dependent hydrolase
MMVTAILAISVLHFTQVECIVIAIPLSALLVDYLESRKKKSTPATYGFLQWNIANAPRDETSADGSCRFGLRFRAILAALQDYQKRGPLDVVTLQEIRGCLSEDGKSELSVQEVMNAIAEHLGMKYVLVGNTRNSLFLHRATLYSNRFKLQDTREIWLPHPCNETKSFNLSCARFEVENRVVCVWNCHVEMELEARLLFARKLIETIHSDSKNASILHFAMGDFNTFTVDRAKQDGILLSELTDLSQDIKQTFLGFPYDTDPAGQRWTGQLDHIYLDQRAYHTQVRVHSCTVQNLSESGWSDHWPLYCTWSLCEKPE